MLAKWLRRRPQGAAARRAEPGRRRRRQGRDPRASPAKSAQDGASVVIASSDDAELCDTCDRVLVMRDGGSSARSRGTDSPPRSSAGSSSASLGPDADDHTHACSAFALPLEHPTADDVREPFARAILT